MSFWDIFRFWQKPAPLQPPATRLVIIRTGVSGAYVRITDEMLPIGTDAQGDARFEVSTTVSAFNLHLRADGYEPYDRVVTLPPGAHHFNVGPHIPITNPTLEIRLPAWPPARAFPAERGRLHVAGRHVVDDANRPWRVRGVSLFLLFLRFLNGDDLTADLQWMLVRGRNEARVFGCVNWGAPLAPGYDRPWERPDFDAKLHAFFALLGDKGLRCEFSVLTYAFDVGEMRAYLQRVYDIAASHWNVSIEGGNECENNGIDIVEVYRGIDRHGVLSAYGNDPERHCDGQPDETAWAACMHREVPCLDYGTSHDLARDFQHSPRNAKDALEFQNLFGVPFRWDEPIGTIEPNDPNMVDDGNGFWHHVGGGGVRTTNPDVIIGSAVVAAFYAGGSTYHPECGARYGRTPLATETTQDGIAATLCLIEQFLPVEIADGQYTRPGLRDFGLAWAADDSDSLIGHAYGVVLGNVQYVVVPMPRPGWVPTPVDNWRIAAVGPIPYLLRLER